LQVLHTLLVTHHTHLQGRVADKLRLQDTNVCIKRVVRRRSLMYNSSGVPAWPSVATIIWLTHDTAVCLHWSTTNFHVTTDKQQQERLLNVYHVSEDFNVNFW